MINIELNTETPELLVEDFKKAALAIKSGGAVEAHINSNDDYVISFLPNPFCKKTYIISYNWDVKIPAMRSALEKTKRKVKKILSKEESGSEEMVDTVIAISIALTWANASKDWSTVHKNAKTLAKTIVAAIKRLDESPYLSSHESFSDI